MDKDIQDALYIGVNCMNRASSSIPYPGHSNLPSEQKTNRFKGAVVVFLENIPDTSISVSELLDMLESENDQGN